MHKYYRNNKMLSGWVTTAKCNSASATRPVPSQGSGHTLPVCTAHRGASSSCSGSQNQTPGWPRTWPFASLTKWTQACFLLPGPQLCLMAFLFFPWAILDLQPKPLLEEVCNALIHPGFYLLPFAFLLAHYFRHFGLEKYWFPFHWFSPAWHCCYIVACSFNWAAPPEKVIAERPFGYQLALPWTT